IGSVGTRSLVYGTAQLQIDLALFGAARAVAQHAWVAPFDLREVLARTFASWTPMLEPAAAAAGTQTAKKCDGQLLGEKGSCSTTDESIKPKDSAPPTCDIFVLAAYLAGNGPAPNCTPTPENCKALAGHTVLTLAGGGMICVPP